MKKICNIENCTNKTYMQSKQCILHSKPEDQKVVDMSGGDFQEELADYIVEYITNNIEAENILLVENLKEYLRYGIERIASDNQSIFLDELNKQKIIFEYIVFDNIKSPEDWNYKSILQKLSKIEFKNCKFYVETLELPECEVNFTTCVFYNEWNLQNYQADNAIYNMCSFKKNVSSFSENNKLLLEEIQFKSCDFFRIILENTIFKKQIFEYSDFHNLGNYSLESIVLVDCVVEDKFIFNRYTLNTFGLRNTVFKNKFEFKENVNGKMEISNSNFEGLADFYNTIFRDFIIQKSIFNDFVGFEKCHFYSLIDTDPTCFQYTTFLSFTNFREAHFHHGLDMRDANLKEYPNFLGAKIIFKNTNKETYRIIKYSFDKIGNATEANKYYAYEMDKEIKDTNGFSYPSKKVTLWLSHNISHHGQSFILPFVLIIILGIIHHYFSAFLDSYTIAEIAPKYHNIIEQIMNGLNNFSKNIIPFKRFLTVGREFISLLFLIGYSTLIYHFIVAVKRTTKR